MVKKKKRKKSLKRGRKSKSRSAKSKKRYRRANTEPEVREAEKLKYDGISSDSLTTHRGKVKELFSGFQTKFFQQLSSLIYFGLNMLTAGNLKEAFDSDDKRVINFLDIIGSRLDGLMENKEFKKKLRLVIETSTLMMAETIEIFEPQVVMFIEKIFDTAGDMSEVALDRALTVLLNLIQNTISAIPILGPIITVILNILRGFHSMVETISPIAEVASYTIATMIYSLTRVVPAWGVHFMNSYDNINSMFNLKSNLESRKQVLNKEAVDAARPMGDLRIQKDPESEDLLNEYTNKEGKVNEPSNFGSLSSSLSSSKEAPSNLESQLKGKQSEKSAVAPAKAPAKAPAAPVKAPAKPPAAPAKGGKLNKKNRKSKNIKLIDYVDNYGEIDNYFKNIYNIGAKLGLYIKLYTNKSNKFNKMINKLNKSLKNKKNRLNNKINKTRKRIKKLLIK